MNPFKKYVARPVVVEAREQEDGNFLIRLSDKDQYVCPVAVFTEKYMEV